MILAGILIIYLGYLSQQKSAIAQGRSAAGKKTHTAGGKSEKKTVKGNN
jgi:phosphatidylglycerol:prolipoprotein diacylglycerol transferase